ncbi:unnamed protein product [Arabidopsis arenosa]|uniref:peroxidase n=1 Tax=Arabidopsis arenosa TaxID=38785 RepID=A0A8S2A2F0_ARAAE|nr:unnamed protein product [Arabidopsis arenosa]
MRFLVGFTVLLTSVIALLIYGATSPANLTGDDFKFPAPSIIRVFFNGASSPANLTDRTYSLHYDYYCESCPSVTAPSIIRVLFSDASLSENRNLEVCFLFSLCISGFKEYETLSTENNASPNLSLKGFDVIDAIKSEREYVSPGGWYSSISSGDCKKFSAVAFKLPAPQATLSLLLASAASRVFSERETVILSGAHSLGIKHCTFFENSLYNFSGTGKPDTELADACLGVVSCSSLVLGAREAGLLGFADETLATESKSSPNLSLKGFDVIDAIKSEREYVSPGGLYCAEPPVFFEPPVFRKFPRFPAREAALVADPRAYPLVTVRKNMLIVSAVLAASVWAVLAASGMLGVGYVWIKFQRWLSSYRRDMNAFSKHLDEKINEAALKLDEIGRDAEQTRNVVADINSQIRDLREEMRAGFAQVADRGDQQLILDILSHISSQIGVDVQHLAGGGGDVQPVAHGGGDVQPVAHGGGDVQPVAHGGGDVQPVAHGGRILTITQGIRSVLPRIFGRQH